MRHDVAGTGFQAELGRPAGQEMDRVAVPARLRPGDDVVIGEPVDPAIGWRIKSGSRLRDFPRFPRRRLIGRAAAGELVGDPPAPSDTLYFSGHPDELPARADGPLDRQPLRAPGAPQSPVTRTARTHETATVQQTIPGGGPALGPQTPLEPLHDQDRRKRQCGAPQCKTAELRLRQPGGSRLENPGEDRCEPLDVVPRAEAVHVTDARRHPLQRRRCPADIVSTGLDSEAAGDRDQDRNALLSGSRGARCAYRSERRTWRC